MLRDTWYLYIAAYGLRNIDLGNNPSYVNNRDVFTFLTQLIPLSAMDAYIRLSIFSNSYILQLSMYKMNTGAFLSNNISNIFLKNQERL